MDKVEKLYKNFGVLADAKDKINEHEKEFLEILAAVKGSGNEKRLASQFIARFFKHFPHLIDQSIDAQLDLCEDDDVSIRKQAIKDLPSLSRDNPEHLLKIADVLAQLLQTDDLTELSTVHNSLMTLFKIDIKGTLRGLFSQIHNGEDIVRERAIKFLCTKLKTLTDDVVTKEGEECLLEESKKALQDVTAAEFVTFMQMLTGLRIAKTVSGQQQLIDIIAEQAELDKEFAYSDPEAVDRFMQCVKQALPFFSCMVPSTRFALYVCDRVLPSLDLLKPVSTGGDLRLEVFQLLAELCPNWRMVTDTDASVPMRTVFERLLEYMPLPPTGADDAENDRPQDDPRLEFSYVECLMYAFHQLGRKHPAFLTDDGNVDLLKDFKLRLQYFARGIQGYIKKLRESLQGKKAEELKTEENKLKVVALKTTSNINVMIRDLFHSPPSYKSNVTPSWKPLPPAKGHALKQQKTSTPTTATPTTTTTTTTTTEVKEETARAKRHTPITFDAGNGAVPAAKVKKVTPVMKGDREIYQPPSGKYSTKVKDFSMRGAGNGRGARRGRAVSYSRGARGRGNWYY